MTAYDPTGAGPAPEHRAADDARFRIVESGYDPDQVEAYIDDLHEQVTQRIRALERLIAAVAVEAGVRHTDSGPPVPPPPKLPSQADEQDDDAPRVLFPLAEASAAVDVAPAERPEPLERVDEGPVQAEPVQVESVEAESLEPDDATDELEVVGGDPSEEASPDEPGAVGGLIWEEGPASGLEAPAMTVEPAAELEPAPTQAIGGRHEIVDEAKDDPAADAWDRTQPEAPPEPEFTVDLTDRVTEPAPGVSVGTDPEPAGAEDGEEPLPQIEWAQDTGTAHDEPAPHDPDEQDEEDEEDEEELLVVEDDDQPLISWDTPPDLPPAAAAGRDPAEEDDDEGQLRGSWDRPEDDRD